MKVKKTIIIDVSTDEKIRELRANAIKLCNKNISYSEIMNNLLSLTLSDQKKMETIDKYYAEMIGKKSR